MRSQFSTDTPFATMLVPTIIQGIAMACFFVPLISLSISGLSPERIPAASGLFNFARITAGSFGTSIVTTLWDRRATLHHARLVEHLSAADPLTVQSLATLQAGGMATAQQSAALNRLVDNQAFMLSVDDIFYASAILFVCLIAVIWLAHPVRQSGASVSATATGAH
jgi:DHA2 family multidrug resistance protein